MPIKLLHKLCLFCSNPFQTYEDDKFHCNDVCKLKHESTKDQEYHPEYDKFGLCRTCGKKISYFRKFCSPLCSLKLPMLIQKNKKDICEYCKNEFTRATNVSKYCSSNCRSSANFKSRQKAIEKSRKNPKERKKGKLVLYEELNRRAEVRRLEEEWRKLVK